MILMVSIIFFLSWCSNLWNLKIDKQIDIIRPIESKISKKWIYELDCKTNYYTTTNIGWEIIKDTYIKSSNWNERDTLYVNNEWAKFFWSDYEIIQDDNNYLVIMRHYWLSWLTEVVSINKDSGIWFDVKTLSVWLSWAPTSTTYLINCNQI